MSRQLAVEVAHRAGSLRLQASFASNCDRLALFGPSGSGKSTLLRILAGLLRPDQGTVVLDGRVLTDSGRALLLAPGVRGIGLVAQSPALFPHLSVTDNLLFGLRSLPHTIQAERVRELSALFGLHALADRRPARLSGGEQQRVALARALAPEPKLLLLDEPFSALDALAKAAIWRALEPYLHARGIATLLVSHDAGEVWTHAETVIRMDAGQVIGTGSPAAMLLSERALALDQLRTQEHPLQRPVEHR